MSADTESDGSNNSATNKSIAGVVRSMRGQFSQLRRAESHVEQRAKHGSDEEIRPKSLTAEDTERHSISKREKLFRHLRWRRLESRDRLKSDEHSDDGHNERNRLSHSQPNLCKADLTEAVQKLAAEKHGRPRKGIIRGDSDDKSPKTTKRQNTVDGVTGMKVEFSGTDEVFDMTPQDDQSATSAMNSPQTAALSSNANREASVESVPGNDQAVAFMVKVRLKDGRDLPAKDASGTSDPYVKFKYRGKLLSKSNTIFKSLNPIWDENIDLYIDEPNPDQPIQVEVFDWDRFAADDFMGSSVINIANLERRKPTELCLKLSDEGNDEAVGLLNVEVELVPQTSDDKQAYIRKSTRTGFDSLRRPGKSVSQVWTSVVNVTILEASGLIPTDFHSNAPLPDPYVKIKLGSEKFKTKHCQKTLEPKWREHFDLHIYDDSNQELELMIYDRRLNVFMGRITVELSTLEREITHEIHESLEDDAGRLLLLISITGTTGTETVGDLGAADSTIPPSVKLKEKYSIAQSFKNVKDIGHLTVKVFKAQGLASADIGGKSDPFCVVELVNAKLQTHTEYKTLNPEWNKIFTFMIKDIHNILEITIYDEDQNKKVEFLGKVAIPLLKIKSGDKKWYALKDRKLKKRAKGQILLEFDIVWNPVKAGIRTFNPLEEKYVAQETKFKRQLFMRNLARVKRFAMEAVEMTDFLQSCFSWESKLRSSIAFAIFLISVYFFELYMAPLGLLMLFVKAYVYQLLIGGLQVNTKEVTEYFDSEDEEEIIEEKEERKSIKAKVQAINDALNSVQNILDFIASLMERIKNTFNFTQPFLSCLAIFVLSAATTVLYFIPVRWLVMAWGINKFTKKLRNPHAIPNNELLDFLSRVPSDSEIRLFGEFRPEPADSLQASQLASSRIKKKVN